MKHAEQEEDGRRSYNALAGLEKHETWPEENHVQDVDEVTQIVKGQPNSQVVCSLILLQGSPQEDHDGIVEKGECDYAEPCQPQATCKRLGHNTGGCV